MSPSVNVIKLFSSSLTSPRNKLDRSSLIVLRVNLAMGGRGLLDFSQGKLTKEKV